MRLARAHPLFAHATLQPLLAPFERLIDGFGAGSQTALQRRQGKADRTAPLAVKFVGLAHLCFYIVGDSFVKRPLQIGQRVVDRIGAPLGKEGRAVEFDQLFFDHAPHQVGGVYFVDPIPKAAVKAVRVEQRQEQLKIFLFAVVGGRGHQQQVAGVGPQFFGKEKAAGLFQLRAIWSSRRISWGCASKGLPLGDIRSSSFE